MNPVCFVVKFMSRLQISYYLLLVSSGLEVVSLSSSMFSTIIFYWKCFLYLSRCTISVVMEGGKKNKSLVESRPGHASIFPIFISHRNVIGVGMKHKPCKYWNSSVFVLSFVMMACEWCCKGLDMVIYDRLFW